MKAVVKTAKGVGNVELLDVSEPVPRAGEAVIEVKFAGVCGTDLHVYHDLFPHSIPVILGHEISGVVVALGEGVGRVAIGERVSVLPSVAVTCGSCRFCRAGNYVFCEKRRGMGHGVDGGFSKYCCVREEMLYRLPNGVSLEAGSLVEPAACCVHAVVELSGVRASHAVLVCGPGPVGLMCLQLARLQGARVIVAGTSRDAGRLRVARSLGADSVVDAESEDLCERVSEFTDGRGVDTALECSGSAGAVEQCIRATASLGTVVQVGIPASPISVPMDAVVFKGLRIMGSMGHTWATWDRTLDLLKWNRLDLTGLVTHKLPMSGWEEAFRLVETGRAIKVLLFPDE